MNKKTLTAALLLLVIFAAFAAPASFAADAPKKVINYANGDAPPVLDPIMNYYLKGSYLFYNLYDGLARTSKEGIPELGYAESYKVSDDGLTWTFKIRKGSKFSDGSPLTARDWEESFKHRLSPEVASPGVSLSLFVKGAEAYNQGKGKVDDVGMKALDDNTLEIKLENPTPFFLDVVCYYIPYKMELVKKDPEWFKKPATYVGNGAFRVKSLNPQTGLVLEKNPHYYDAANVKIDIVNYNFIADDAIALEAYRKGELNVNDSVNAEGIKAFKDSKELAIYPRINTAYISLQTGNIKDARIRRAMSLALDREALIKGVLGMPYIPAQGLVPFGIHWGNKEFREVAGNLIKEDIAEAKKLLAEAGYPDGKGLPTFRIITMNNQEDTDSAQAWQSMWKQIGIQSEITAYESSVYWDLIDPGEWEAARDGWTGDYDDPRTNLFLWMAYREGPEKDVRWYDSPNAKEFDRLMRLADTELDYEKRMNLFKEAERVILEDMPIIPVLHAVEPILIKPEVKGIVKSNIGNIYFRYADITR
ncbi:MAG: peptide ABC transporter substrate-binding protein [Synergistaceae bacterium]|jgi:oligopeptide transport system substrate-binding protein|nr:peptide ABC transporter substrate-binding protein [Synergistaceae bacterium]